uniref:G protein-coupled receptor 142 n=1 Tax=Sphenodon punctatus TaxID=8508 RepID=A0A8D0H509_SPHPU
MVPLPNSTVLPWVLHTGGPRGEEISPCGVGIIPIIYYSILLGLGLPVNVLAAVVLSRLAARTHKSSYWYLLALTASDILTQVFVVFAGFLLQSAILACQVPSAFAHAVNVLQFTANHASIWVTVLLTVDRYVALCHPLHYRAVSYPLRTRKIVGAVFAVALATGIPFYWWLDVWHDSVTTMDEVLKWLHCFTIYFIPCSIFLFTNSIIISKLKRSGGAHRRLGKTMAILLAITTVFIVLWAPRTFVIIYHLCVASVKQDWRIHLALDVANMVAMFNTSLNFFLFCFVSKTFRRTVWEVLAPYRPPCAQPRRKKGSSDPTLKPLGALDGTPLLGTNCPAPGKGSQSPGLGPASVVDPTTQTGINSRAQNGLVLPGG